MTNEDNSSQNISDAPIGTPPVNKSEPKDPVPSKPATEADLAEVKAEIKEEMSGFERSTLRWTRASFAVVLATAIFICLQWLEIHSGGKDTHDLAVAADTQAKKMGSMSDAADKIRQAADGMVTQEQRIADNAKQSLEASNRQNANALDATIKQFRDEQRAWVGLNGMRVVDFEAKKPITIDIGIMNAGKTPARSVKLRVRANLSDVPINGPDPSEIAELRKAEWEPQPAIAPQGSFVFEIGKLYAKGRKVREENQTLAQGIMDRFDFIKSRAVTFYNYGEISYFDVSGRQHTTTFCIFLADPEAKTVSFCTDFNDIN